MSRYKRPPHPIKGLLVMRRITQEQFAAMTNYSQEYISQVHNGHKPVTKEYAAAASFALQVPPSKLFSK